MNNLIQSALWLLLSFVILKEALAISIKIRL